MAKIIFDIFTYLLAVYGFIYLVVGVVNSVRQRIGSESSKVKMVLLVKNQERTIEGIIRNIFTGDILRKVMSSEKLTIMDMDSNDGTVDILKKLKDVYCFFDIAEEKDKRTIAALFDERHINDEIKKPDIDS